MEKIDNTERIEQNTFETMDYMENKIKEAIEKLMTENENRFYDFEERNDSDMELYHYDKGYAEGIHDALVDILKELEIETDEEYYNPTM